MNLFQLEKITLHSGKISDFKIECDNLTEADWDTLAYLGSRIVGSFSSVECIPRGGIPFAKAMEKYVGDKGPHLVVDDVLTTGGSILKELKENCIGLVVFARGGSLALSSVRSIKAIFYMNEAAEDAREKWCDQCQIRHVKQFEPTRKE